MMPKEYELVLTINQFYSVDVSKTNTYYFYYSRGIIDILTIYTAKDFIEIDDGVQYTKFTKIIDELC